MVEKVPGTLSTVPAPFPGLQLIIDIYGNF